MCIRDSFNGVTYSDAFSMFREHAISRQEDVMFMPDACFPFYFNVYMDYLRSADSQNDSDAASCFFSLVDFKQTQIITLEKWIVRKTVETVGHIAANQIFYDAEHEIYGSFRERGHETLRRFPLD